MVEGVPPQYDYEKIECTFHECGISAKYVKRDMVELAIC